MEVTLSGMVTEVMDAQLRKAEGPIEVTVRPASFSGMDKEPGKEGSLLVMTAPPFFSAYVRSCLAGRRAKVEPHPDVPGK